MRAYDTLAGFYDQLTRDVSHAGFADWYEARFKESRGSVQTVLDLACGTGTLTCLMASRGYEMIGVDRSSEMLSRAAEKALLLDARARPLLLCQRLDELDLYGTVDAAVCCLDGFNYMPENELSALFSRLILFIRPGGLLLFDMLSPERLRAMDGSVFLDEADGVFCVWRGNLEENRLNYGMDIFTREGTLWRRDAEEHSEYIHEPETVLRLLGSAGFISARTRLDGPESDSGRIFFSAIRK